ncbi:MAG: hypothetical protein J6M10_07235, partial [Clostridia bacterium]|nr:hypothetical protein [Clostridia bacterium]
GFSEQNARIFLMEISSQCTESAQIFRGDLLVYKNLCTSRIVFLQEKDGKYAENALFSQGKRA